MRHLLIAVIIFGASAVPARSSGVMDDPRFPDLLRTYVARCTPALAAQGMSASKAEEVCGCTFKGTAAEMTNRETY
jgi:hypothetical protein